MRWPLPLALLALTACADIGERVTAAVPALSERGAARDGTNEGIRTLAMFNGTVKVRGPEGYCIDRQASRTRTGFAVLAACARVSEAEIVPSLDGLLTVQIGEDDSAVVTGNEATLARLLAEEAGRGLLSEGSGAVTVHETESQDGLVLVRYTDPEARAMEGTEGPSWRAFLDLGGRSAVLSLRAFSASPLSPREGEILIRAAATALAEANTGG